MTHRLGFTPSTHVRRSQAIPHALYIAAAVPIVFLLSTYLLQAYQYGDQLYYRAFYSALSGIRIDQVLFEQRAKVSSGEPLFGLLMWVGSNLDIPKNIYVSFFNTVLVFSLVALLRKHEASFLVIFLSLSNFYLLVLLTGAERLKFAYIVLILAALTSGRIRTSFWAIAPLFHFQSLINLASLAMEKLPTYRKQLLYWYNRPLRSLFVIVLAVAAGSYFWLSLGSFVLSKAVGYYQTTTGFQIAELVGLLLLTLLITRKRLEILLLITPILLAAIVVGSARVNMIGFVAIYFLLLREQRIGHVLSISVLSYFSLKSIPFLQRVFTYGDGFYQY